MTVWLTQVCHYCCCMCTVNYLDLPNTDSAVVITNFEHKNEFYDQETSNLVRMHIATRINVLSICMITLPISFLKPYKDPASTEDGLYNQLKESKLKMIPSEAIE